MNMSLYKKKPHPGQKYAKVPFFWTSGRKCNFDGCDKPEFFPKLVNGWFWSANQVKSRRIKGNHLTMEIAA